MPAIVIDNHGIEAVARAGAFLEELLRVAESVKQTSSLEPPLVESDFENIEDQFNAIYDSELTSNSGAEARIQRFAIIETAVRETFKNLVATTPIESPNFVRVWNLFDVLSILSDKELCDPALLLWLVEELLDTQTIVGCRKIFDFLESRRETITSKHFQQKKLIILRACNELARRLSRHLDPAFAGRILIFMFQSFPLGDKSAVNLRGEYHVENVTTFDQDPPKSEEDADKMDVDTDVGTPGDGSRKGKPNGVEGDKKPLDPDALYPVFWALQESFNQPKRLFEPSNFASFKNGIETTMAAFLAIKDEQSRNKEKQERQPEDFASSLKRRRADGEDTLANGFNAKYLTSRDLFKLEISDLTFRRNILIQVLIIMEFLLALSPAAKKKFAVIEAPNKSTTYSDQQLSEEDLEWVTKTKDSIISYLNQGLEGPYFVRLLQTVLARDKNWVWWKAENCPPIELPRLAPEVFVQSMNSAGKLAATKRLRATPMGSLSLDFLDDEEEERNMAKLMNPERFKYPSLEVFKRGIADDDFEIEMPTNNETQNAAVEGKASKAWRALRIASKFKLAAFDKIENDDKIDVIFEEAPPEEDTEEQEGEITNGETVFPEDRRPIVVVDASPGSVLVKQLITQHPRTFTKVAVHVTRKPAEGEVNGQDYHFVDAQAFNMMRDGDQFLEFNDEGDNVHGTSRKVVDAITDNDRIAVMEMDKDGAQQVKDNGFDARFIFIQPPATEVLEAQAKDIGLTDERIQQAIKSATEAAEHANTNPDFYHSVVEADFKALESSIFGSELGGETPAVQDAVAGDEDVAMVD